MRKKLKDVFCGDLVNIISDEEYQIIKFCYSECAKGEEKNSRSLQNSLRQKAPL